MKIILLLIPFIIAIVPLFLKNWKSLVFWHVIFSVFISYFISLIDSSEAPAGAGGAALYAFLLLILHWLSSGFKGIKIYMKNERGARMFPLYGIVSVVSYVSIFAVIFIIFAKLTS